jgi:hypothetical protein
MRGAAFVTALQYAGFVLLCTCACASATAQDSGWKSLSRVTYKKVYDEMLGMKVDVPVFSQDVRNLEGKEMTLRGYIVPTNGYISTKEFVLSAFPYSSCFFCGGAGPETVAEIHALEPIKYTDQPIAIKGILELNDNDPNRLTYTLHKVKRVQ